jgi:hypothetical protein
MRRTALMIGSSATALLVAACAQTVPSAAQPIASKASTHTAVDACPRMDLGRPQRSPTATPVNDPVAEALSQAIGQQGRGAFADVYGSQIVDQPPGRVALCVTDVARGRLMGQAAKEASPSIDLARLDIYHCPYTQREADAAIAKLIKNGDKGFEYPIYSYAFSPDASGIVVTSSVQGAASQAFHDHLVAVAGGIPVQVTQGSPVVVGL